MSTVEHHESREIFLNYFDFHPLERIYLINLCQQSFSANCIFLGFSQILPYFDQGNLLKNFLNLSYKYSNDYLEGFKSKSTKEIKILLIL